MWWVIFLRYALSIYRPLYWKCLCSFSLSDCLQSSPCFFCNFTLLPFQSISSCHILILFHLILLLPFSANPHLFFLQVPFNPPTLPSSTFCFPLKFPLDQKMSLPSRSFPPPLFEMCVREAALSWAFQVTCSLQRSFPLLFSSTSPVLPFTQTARFFFFFTFN